MDLNFLFPSIFFGVSIGISAWMVLSVILAPRTSRGIKNRFEADRRNLLRKKAPIFRYFEPAIDELAAGIERSSSIDHEEFGDYLNASGEPLPWKAGEFLGTKFVEALIALVVAYGFTKFIVSYSTPVACVISLLAAGGYIWIATNNIKKKAQKRRAIVKRSFSSAIDLLALMMEVGGSFQESIRVVARENLGKPLGEELALIVNDIEMGKPRKHALDSFAGRMRDDDITEVVFACNESEELGVPIADTLKTQADRMRTKRTSWAEKAAHEAEVTLVFPSMLIMMACLITVGTPFILAGISQFFGT